MADEISIFSSEENTVLHRGNKESVYISKIIVNNIKIIFVKIKNRFEKQQNNFTNEKKAICRNIK